MNTLHKSLTVFAGTALSLVPAITLAQGPDFGYLDNALAQVSGLITQLVPLLIALALLFFIWGLVQFIMASGDEEAKTEGKRKIIWGIITLFVIVSVWGLVGLLNQLTGVKQGIEFTPPTTGL